MEGSWDWGLKDWNRPGCLWVNRAQAEYGLMDMNVASGDVKCAKHHFLAQRNRNSWSPQLQGKSYHKFLFRFCSWQLAILFLGVSACALQRKASKSGSSGKGCYLTKQTVSAIALVARHPSRRPKRRKCSPIQEEGEGRERGSQK